jgi:hypothetical protein
VPVDQGLGEAGAGAAQADAVGFVEAALVRGGGTDVHAGQALQGVGHVMRRQLAHVLGGDHLQARVGLALGVQGAFHRTADAGDDDRVQLGRLLPRVLCMHAGRHGQAGEDRRAQC